MRHDATLMRRDAPMMRPWATILKWSTGMMMHHDAPMMRLDSSFYISTDAPWCANDAPVGNNIKMIYRNDDASWCALMRLRHGLFDTVTGSLKLANSGCHFDTVFYGGKTPTTWHHREKSPPSPTPRRHSRAALRAWRSGRCLEICAFSLWI